MHATRACCAFMSTLLCTRRWIYVAGSVAVRQTDRLQAQTSTSCPSPLLRCADGTDRLVQLVQEEHDAAVARGEEPALYGAKITGGGCGGEARLHASFAPSACAPDPSIGFPAGVPARMPAFTV